MSSNKVRKRIAFYVMNQDTGVAELELLSAATTLLSVVTGKPVGVEDFIRSSALDVAARMIIREKRRIEAQLAAPPAAGPTADPAVQPEPTDKSAENQGETDGMDGTAQADAGQEQQPGAGQA